MRSWAEDGRSHGMSSYGPWGHGPLADKLGSRFRSDGLSMRNLLEDNRWGIGCRGALPRRVHRRHAGQVL